MDLNKNVEKDILAMTAKREKEILKAYKKALDNIRKELGVLAAQYEKNGMLKISDLRVANRLEGLYKNINFEIKTMTGKADKEILANTTESYKRTYYKMIYEAEQKVKSPISFSLLNPKTINAIVQAPIDKLTLTDRLIANRVDITQRIRENITDGLIRGKGYVEISKGVKEVLDGNAGKALTVVRTEAHRVQSQGVLDSLDTAEQSGLKTVKVWDATLDNLTRDDHRDMDGVKAELDEDFQLPDGSSASAPGLSGEPGQDINCRCRLRIEFVGFEPTVRRVRGEGIVPYQTYNQWAEGKNI